MTTQTPTIIYKRLRELESELQRLKIDAYFLFPQKSLQKRYPEKNILRALKETRKQIWLDRYAKTIKGLP